MPARTVRGRWSPAQVLIPSMDFGFDPHEQTDAVRRTIVAQEYWFEDHLPATGCAIINFTRFHEHSRCLSRSSPSMGISGRVSC